MHFLTFPTVSSEAGQVARQQRMSSCTLLVVVIIVDLVLVSGMIMMNFSRGVPSWPLCPMVLNRICEVLVFWCSDLTLHPSFSWLQIVLCSFALVVYDDGENWRTIKWSCLNASLLLVELTFAVLLTHVAHTMRLQRAADVAAMEAERQMSPMQNFLLSTRRLDIMGQRWGELARNYPPDVNIYTELFTSFNVITPRPPKLSLEGIKTVKQPDGSETYIAIPDEDGYRSQKGGKQSLCTSNASAVDSDEIRSIYSTSTQNPHRAPSIQNESTSAPHPQQLPTMNTMSTEDVGVASDEVVINVEPLRHETQVESGIQ